MSGWEVRFSNSRQIPYFYNAQTSQSVWDTPAELTPSQVAALPGAAKYLNAQDAGAKAGAGGAQDGKVRASHILAKHAGSRRPSSWRQDKITIPLSEARAIIQKHKDYLDSLPADQRNAEFAKIAADSSDCSSAKKGGDLGWFSQGQMQKVFEDAAFSLQPGQMSDLVESDSGVHIILRTG